MKKIKRPIERIERFGDDDDNLDSVVMIVDVSKKESELKPEPKEESEK